MVHLHKNFTDFQVKELMERYLNKKIARKYIQEILGIKKTRFFALLKQYQKNSANFSIQYSRKISTRKISQDIEKNIFKELSKDKELIQNKSIPLNSYNYSYIKKRLSNKYNQSVSLPTIINRAKSKNFYLKRHKKKKIHDREVLTNYIGELIQHDSSHHKWSPYASEKWHLITSLDDYSRFILYAILIKKETSLIHIMALESVILKYGPAFSYYVDSHSIFRFVQGRDSFWRNHYKLTDDVDTQWKQVLNDCNIKVIYALSPQSKGKIERSYGWLQDHIVRTCARENISDIRQAQLVLKELIKQYNYQWIHSTTKEIPYLRFQRALKENQSLFREFKLKPPFKSSKDIFCLRANRTIDAYRRVSINTLKFNIRNSVPYNPVELRIYPLSKTVSEVRFWCNDTLIDIQKAKNSDLKINNG